MTAQSPSYSRIPRWLALASVALALLAATALCAFDTYNTIYDDNLPMLLMGWLVSTTTGVLLIISWTQAARLYRNSPTAARTIIFLNVAWIALVLLIWTISPWVWLSDRVLMQTVAYTVLPGLILPIFAAFIALAILRNSTDRGIFNVASLLSGCCAILLITLIQNPELTITTFSPTPKLALEAELATLNQNAQSASVEILQSQQIDDILIVWWRLRPSGTWYYRAQDESYKLNRDRWCTKVSALTFRRTIYGSGWDASGEWYICDDGDVGFGSKDSVAFAYGSIQNGNSARIQWADGRVDEVQLKDGRFLVLRKDLASRNHPLQFTILDQDGQLLLEDLDWQR